MEKAEKQRARRTYKERKEQRREEKTEEQRRGGKAGRKHRDMGRGLPQELRVLRETEPPCSGSSPASPSAWTPGLLFHASIYNSPLLTQSGHLVECFNRVPLPKLSLNDVMEIKTRITHIPPALVFLMAE